MRTLSKFDVEMVYAPIFMQWKVGITEQSCGGGQCSTTRTGSNSGMRCQCWRRCEAVKSGGYTEWHAVSNPAHRASCVTFHPIPGLSRARQQQRAQIRTWQSRRDVLVASGFTLCSNAKLKAAPKHHAIHAARTGPSHP